MINKSFASGYYPSQTDFLKDNPLSHP